MLDTKKNPSGMTTPGQSLLFLYQELPQACPEIVQRHILKNDKYKKCPRWGDTPGKTVDILCFKN
jgi:oxalate decarboxylase/phosphoglucose isomerase-like protein (cupin superfamily)